MQKPVCLEQYPLATVLIANLVMFLIYGISAYLLFLTGIVWFVAYVLFILVLEIRLLSRHCVDCYYYGRTCAFGKGRISALFFPKGNPERFCSMAITWKDIVPDFLMFIVPALAGVLLLLREFSFFILALVVALILLGFAGNALVRGRFACRFCRQREIGCPAERLFGKNTG